MDLMTYQRHAVELSRVEPFLLIEHAPRIGMTFAFAREAVLTVSGQNVVYLAATAEMAAEFMGYCKHIADQRGEPCGDIQSRVEHERIILFLEFASGRTIQAQEAGGRSLIGTVATVIIDQAGFIPDIDVLIDHALPMIMFGGRFILLSRHQKDQSHFFNLLLREAASDLRSATPLHIPLKRAIGDGLFRLICKLKGDAWSADAEAAWERHLRHLFGADAMFDLDLGRA